MWSRIKAAFLHSLTVAVSFLTCLVGFLFENIDGVSSVVSTQDFKDNLSVIVGNDPVVLGRWMMAISVIVLLARLRSIIPWDTLFKRKKNDDGDDR